MKKNRNIRLIDTTLRDGEQAPGVCFHPEQKVDLLKMLFDAGVRDFEIGTPAIGTEEQDAIRRMLALKLDASLSVWCRATLDDLKLAHHLGTKMVNLSLPVSSIQIEAIGKNEDWVLTQLISCLEYASQHFEFIAVGAQDGSRADDVFLQKYIKTALRFPNVMRIRIADTVGIMNPFSVFSLFQELTTMFPATEFEFHGHNDLGMANANGLAAIKGGADLVSVTVNGLGERCGNTPLEEILIALQYSEGIHLPIDKKLLKPLCEKVALLSGRRIPLSKPFNGEMCFTHESGIHTRSLLVNELAYQPFNPEDFGAEKRFVFGKHSGSAALKALLIKRNLKVDKEVIDFLLDAVKKSKRLGATAFSEANIVELYNDYCDIHAESDETQGLDGRAIVVPFHKRGNVDQLCEHVI
jgi:homocitrate synthase NifV